MKKNTSEKKSSESSSPANLYIALEISNGSFKTDSRYCSGFEKVLRYLRNYLTELKHKENSQLKQIHVLFFTRLLITRKSIENDSPEIKENIKKCNLFEEEILDLYSVPFKCKKHDINIGDICHLIYNVFSKFSNFFFNQEESEAKYENFIGWIKELFIPFPSKIEEVSTKTLKENEKKEEDETESRDDNSELDLGTPLTNSSKEQDLNLEKRCFSEFISKPSIEKMIETHKNEESIPQFREDCSFPDASIVENFFSKVKIKTCKLSDSITSGTFEITSKILQDISYKYQNQPVWLNLILSGSSFPYYSSSSANKIRSLSEEKKIEIFYALLVSEESLKASQNEIHKNEVKEVAENEIFIDDMTHIPPEWCNIIPLSPAVLKNKTTKMMKPYKLFYTEKFDTKSLKPLMPKSDLVFYEMLNTFA